MKKWVGNLAEYPHASKLKPTLWGESLIKILRELEQTSTGVAWTKPIVRAVEVRRRGLTPGELQRTAGTENGAVPSIGTAPLPTPKWRHTIKR